ncbi:MAG: hypothetical protein GY722_17315, partial [bacterium]|nr:hypothetical protein [bacterium]
ILLGLELLIVLVADIEGWLITAVVLSAIALAGLGSAWFKGWLRERPAAGAPGYKPMALVIGSFGFVPLVGLASPSGLEPSHGVLGAVGILLAWGYMKGGIWALHSLRFGLPLVALIAALASPLVGGVLLIAVGGGLAYLAWTAEARLAVDPMPELPTPRKRRS